MKERGLLEIGNLPENNLWFVVKESEACWFRYM